MNTYEILKELSKQKKISIRQLEMNFGYSNGYLAKWKNNTPNSDELVKLADYFGVSTDYLLGRTEDPSLSFSTFGSTKPKKQTFKNEVSFRIDQNKEELSEAGIDKNDISEYMEDVDAYAELRKKMLLEKRKR